METITDRLVLGKPKASRELDIYLDRQEARRSGINRNKPDKRLRSAIQKVEELVKATEKLKDLE